MPKSIKVIAWARAMRWVGWGFGESLIPIFIFAFSSTFAEAGLFRSTYEIIALISLPLIGVWADRKSAKYLILLSLILYPIVGIGYLLAGLLGLAVFLIIARAVNGVTWELENIGVDTYYRRMARQDSICASFGYIDTWSYFAWIVAALVGLALVPYMPIYYLFAAIIPFDIVAYFIARRAPKDHINSGLATATFIPKPVPHKPVFETYSKALSEWRTWNTQLWLLGALVLFSGLINALMWFYIPIDAYISGANLQLVILISVIGAVPSLFGYALGRFADVRNKYAILSGGLLLVALVALGLAIFPQYAFKLIASFILGISLELFVIVRNDLVTVLGSSETYGQRGSAFESLVTLGDLAAPLILGIGLDILGFSSISFIVAGIAFILGIIYRLSKT